MIEITRTLARTFRGVLKKIATARGQRDQPTAIILQTDRNGLHVRARNASIGVEFSQSGSYSNAEIAIPAEALADFEGRKDGAVQLERSAEGVTASWQDGVVPQTRTYGVVQARQLPVMPAFPTRMECQPDELLSALRDASTMAANDAVRYAVNNIQLRGKAGKLAATDGKQLLVQQGFHFPWDDDVLVPASSVFGCKELANQKSVSVGRSEQFITLTAGSWTLHLAIDKDGRFPQTDSLIPGARQTATVFEVDPGDAEFLLRTLDSLPGGNDDNAPVTIDGNGKLIVRAKDDQQPTTTEVELARSTVQGKSTRFVTDRGFLSRALNLGFSRMQVYGPDKPIVCHDEKRTYLWVPLDAKQALASGDQTIRLSSVDTVSSPGAATTEQLSPHELPPVETVPMNESPTTETPREHDGNGKERSGIVEVLAEAEAIKDLLRQAYTRTHQLITSVKRYRKQAHVVQTSLKALKQLQTIDA